MNRTLVTSTDIASIGYDPQSQVLEVEFKKGGRVYRYDAVPPEAHEALVNSLSVGKHFAARIKGKYAYREVKGE